MGIQRGSSPRGEAVHIRFTPPQAPWFRLGFNWACLGARALFPSDVVFPGKDGSRGMSIAMRAWTVPRPPSICTIVIFTPHILGEGHIPPDPQDSIHWTRGWTRVPGRGAPEYLSSGSTFSPHVGRASTPMKTGGAPLLTKDRLVTRATAPRFAPGEREDTYCIRVRFPAARSGLGTRLWRHQNEGGSTQHTRRRRIASLHSDAVDEDATRERHHARGQRKKVGGRDTCGDVLVPRCIGRSI